jgi:Mg2+-importing ATPase
MQNYPKPIRPPSTHISPRFVGFGLPRRAPRYIIRTARIPFVESHASPALIATTIIIICAIGIALPFTWAGSALGFTPLPRLYWPLVVAMLLAYAILTHFVKVWFIRKWGL